MDYGDIIEYIDGTRDLNFEATHKWARENNVTFDELIERREEKDGKLHRYFQIGIKPQPYTPTEEELKSQVREVRNQYLQETDFTQLPDAPFTEEEKAQYAEYRQYLRNYTEDLEWWKQNPLMFNKWNNKE